MSFMSTCVWEINCTGGAVRTTMMLMMVSGTLYVLYTVVTVKVVGTYVKRGQRVQYLHLPQPHLG